MQQTKASDRETRPSRPFRARQLSAEPPRMGATRKRLLWLGVLIVVTASIPLVLLVGAYGWMRLSDSVAPGVRVGAVPVGGMRLEEAAETLDRTWNQELWLTAVDTRDAGRVWPVQPSQFGLSVDAARSADKAYAYARQGGLMQSVVDMVDAFANGWEMQPLVAFDPVAARAGMESLYPSAYIPAIDAQLGLAAGEVTSTAAQWGRQLNIDSSMELIAADPDAILLRYGFIPLVTSPIPPAIGEVAAAAERAESLLTSRPTLRAYDPVADEWLEFTPTRDEASAWLRIRDAGPSLVVEVDKEAVKPFIASLQIELGEERTIDEVAAMAALLAQLEGEPAEPLRVKYLPRYYIVEPRDTLISISFKVGIPYWKWLEENPEVKTRGLRIGESITIPPRDAMLEIPVVEDKRIVISISEQHMWLKENGEPVIEHIISTGIPNSPTLPGVFQVKSRYVNAYASNWDLYMPHFLGIYHATPNLLNGIHGLPLLSNGRRLWEDVLGSPASYGCVILDLQAAEHLFTWAEDGVVVEIRA